MQAPLFVSHSFSVMSEDADMTGWVGGVGKEREEVQMRVRCG